MACTWEKAVSSFFSPLLSHVIQEHIESFKAWNRNPTIHKFLSTDCQIYPISFLD